MFKPEEIPADLPDEVKAFLVHLKPEPEALCQKRKRLQAELGKQLPSAKGSLQRLLNKLRAALLAMETQAPFPRRTPPRPTRHRPSSSSA